MKPNIFFISGIDTGIGKTVVTGLLAKQHQAAGRRVITQKLVQTGCTQIADDIAVHRAIMGIPMQEADAQKLTMPAIYRYPASPHLAAKLDGQTLNPRTLTAATQALAQQYDVVLIEGAGGLMVPLTEDLLTLDYIKQQGYPVILVTSGRLGSINHTLLSLHALRQHNVPLHMLVFNHIHDSRAPQVAQDCLNYLQRHLAAHFPQALFEETAWIHI